MKLDAQLLRWAETSNGGFTVTLIFGDEDEARQYFRDKTLRKGKQAGQLFAVEFTELDDFGNEPAAKPRRFEGGPIARLLITEWCKSPLFWEWQGVTNEHASAQHVKRMCIVESRNEIDSNPMAKARFQERIRKPYTAWLEQQQKVAA